MMSYKEKYMKYKAKYLGLKAQMLGLKEQLGGVTNDQRIFLIMNYLLSMQIV